jgi:hypothetical protein
MQNPRGSAADRLFPGKLPAGHGVTAAVQIVAVQQAGKCCFEIGEGTSRRNKLLGNGHLYSVEGPRYCGFPRRKMICGFNVTAHRSTQRFPAAILPKLPTK